ncbi:TPA: prephenate dehydrogenase [Candidatus Poribacteria bacterium]|nr:prephenate dehydrogenase [Candidatus Poribacteria bacterium]
MDDNFKRIQNITILGVGLIGGSLGLALRKHNFSGTIMGLGRRLSTLEIALKKGAVDGITLNFAEAIESTDIVVISTPVELIAPMTKQVAKYAKDGCIITDVGSVKRVPVSIIESFLLTSLRSQNVNLHFVGAHPMAGSEKFGASAAQANLFENALCILTPTEKTNLKALEMIKSLWRTVGANVTVMSPTEHDFLIAAASHLPHLTACLLARTVGDIQNSAGNALDFTSTGFSDTTRIASGSPDIWKGIFMQNADMLIPLIETLIENLEAFRKTLVEKDEEQLERILTQAKRVRDSINK